MNKNLLINFSIATILILIGLTQVSCGDINTVDDPHFTDDGELVEKPDLFRIALPQQINFYVEVSGSMNGFFRGNYPTKFKKDVFHVMNQLSGSDVKILSNGGAIDNSLSIQEFQSLMNTGGFASNASTHVPTMLQTIIDDIDSTKTAVLISDMIYSPVGNSAPEVLLSQYNTMVADKFGKAQKSVSLVAAKSNFLDKSGNTQVSESPYYYLIIGNSSEVAFVRNAISSLLELNGSLIGNIETGMNYKQPAYSFGNCKEALQVGDNPSFEGYDDSEYTSCNIQLNVDISGYRWLIADKETFKKCFSIKSNYGSIVNVKNIEIKIDNFNQKELKRKATAIVDIEISNMQTDSDVLEWWVDTKDIDGDYTEFAPYLNAANENDRTGTYSLEDFLKGLFQGGVLNKVSNKHNYILISKESS